MHDDDLRWARTLVHDVDPGPVPVLDLDAVMDRGDRVRRAAARGRALAVVAAAALVIGVVVALPRVASPAPAAPTPGPTATSPTPAPSTTTPSPGPSATSPSPMQSVDATAKSLLTIPTDVPPRLYPTEPTLGWHRTTGTGPGPCLDGHLPTGVTTAASADIVALVPTVVPVPSGGPRYTYRATVLDAGTAAGATAAATALSARLDECRSASPATAFAFPAQPGSPSLPTRVNVPGGGVAVMVYGPATAASRAPHDEYVGFTVVDRYVVVLSLQLYEKDQKDLTTVAVDPLVAAVTRAGYPPAPLATPPQCAAAHLTGRETGGGSMASQPFSVITLTNTGTAACTLTGYPRALVHDKSGKEVAQLHSTGVYEVNDPGPVVVPLAPGGSAWFAIGTGTAYGGPIVQIASVSVVLGDGAVSVPVVLDGDAAKAGDPLPVSVTAFAPGRGPG